MPEIQIINPTTYPNWDELVLEAPGHSFFHSSSWAKVLTEAYNYDPAYFAIFDSSRLSSLIPVMEIRSILTGRRGVSLPFTDFCEPIAQDEHRFGDLLDYVFQYGTEHGWKYFEIRGGKKFLFNTPHSSQYHLHTLGLTPKEERVLSGFRESTKRNIKKAVKAGVEVKICNSFDSVKSFYRLNCMTRKHHGVPPQPFRFFRMVYDHIISKNEGFVALATHTQRVIAGAVFFHFGKGAVYKYGASDAAYQDLRANNLVMWEAIKWYCRNRYKSISFGRTDPQHKGLIQFKSGWRPKEETIEYYKYNLRERSALKNETGTRTLSNVFLQLMPSSLSRIVGSLLYRHVG